MEKNYKKDLQLKSNSVKRLLKECQMYDKEVLKLQAKYDELKLNGVDEYDINKQNEYLQESTSARNIGRTKL
jgi:tubulin-specific chaperone A